MKTSRVKRKPSKAWKCAALMPTLCHQIPDQPFDIAKSEVVNWLCAQPVIRQALFDFYRSEDAIVFRDGRWLGAENNRELDDKLDKWVMGFHEEQDDQPLE
jgi:hypothetical protein